jgi:hypothetical protein
MASALSSCSATSVITTRTMGNKMDLLMENLLID